MQKQSCTGLEKECRCQALDGSSAHVWSMLLYSVIGETRTLASVVSFQGWWHQGHQLSHLEKLLAVASAPPTHRSVHWTISRGSDRRNPLILSQTVWRTLKSCGRSQKIHTAALKEAIMAQLTYRERQSGGPDQIPHESMNFMISWCWSNTQGQICN